MRLANIQGAVLVAGEPRRSLDEVHQAAESTIDFDREYEADQISVDPLGNAIEAATHFYAVFGWRDPVDFVLRGLQEEGVA